MKSILIIWLGGGIGSVLRYLMQVSMARYVMDGFPAGTFIVNITGCFIIGLLYGLSSKYGWLTPGWQLFLVAGFCGGYTTFSGFSYESIAMIRQGNYMPCMFYIVLSVLLGLLSTLGGAAIFRN